MLLRFIRDTSGATAIEYGLIAALIAASLIFGMGQIGQSMNNQFTSVSEKVNDAGIE
ncbi:Flp family type IVb pilin [Pseudohoeflea suaedae]|uniref:Flp family type IVb pilin n=1 Tax=Pseudohoeflea suaedae TaxID=877384 RepID=A0A4R5PI13_9HYPH|nr:Flp family type IVb pilin [Pseudohoeflea suaedae]TDH34865.1 Flp family type IVb pilin [Pseudohoeflea suaedae]